MFVSQRFSSCYYSITCQQPLLYYYECQRQEYQNSPIYTLLLPSAQLRILVVLKYSCAHTASQWAGDFRWSIGPFPRVFPKRRTGARADNPCWNTRRRATGRCRGRRGAARPRCWERLFNFARKPPKTFSRDSRVFRMLYINSYTALTFRAAMDKNYMTYSEHVLILQYFIVECQ